MWLACKVLDSGVFLEDGSGLSRIKLENSSSVGEKCLLWVKELYNLKNVSESKDSIMHKRRDFMANCHRPKALSTLGWLLAVMIFNHAHASGYERGSSNESVTDLLLFVFISLVVALVAYFIARVLKLWAYLLLALALLFLLLMLGSSLGNMMQIPLRDWIAVLALFGIPMAFMLLGIWLGNRHAVTDDPVA